MRQTQRPSAELCAPLINLTGICVKGMSLGTSPGTEADFTLTTQRLSRLHLEGHQQSPLGPLVPASVFIVSWLGSEVTG